MVSIVDAGYTIKMCAIQQASPHPHQNFLGSGLEVMVPII